MFKIGDEVMMNPAADMNKYIHRSPFPDWFKRGWPGEVIGLVPSEPLPLVHITRDGLDCSVAPERLALSEGKKHQYIKELEDIRNMLYSNSEGE